MRRGVLAGVLFLFALNGAGSVALAAPDLSLQHAQDGTLVVVGAGWRVGQQLIVSLGPDRFTAYVDSAGSFEVATGEATYPGPLAIHPSRDLAFARLDLADTSAAPNPLAVLFAQSLANGAALVAVLLGLLRLAHLAHRRRTEWRYAAERDRRSRDLARSTRRR